MSNSFAIISPVDGQVYAERAYTTAPQIAQTLSSAKKAFSHWRHTLLSERQQICRKFVDRLCEQSDPFSQALTQQMGRPISYAAGEFKGVRERSEYFIEAAPNALADSSSHHAGPDSMFIRRDPKGVVLVIAPWNYPYLTAINSIIPSILAGNSIILKHSRQTALCAEHLADCFSQAGLPHGVFQYLHSTDQQTQALVKADDVDHIVFTGSTSVGRLVGQTATAALKSVTLELGGKDPAYVREDSPLEQTAEELASGAFFNSGQSCCAIERIYVAEAIYQPFVDSFVAAAMSLKLGNPLDVDTTLGPVVNIEAAERIQQQVNDAIARGAQALRPEAVTGLPPNYLSPQILTGVDHTMSVMRDETFGPIVGIMPVADDDNAIQMMNDSSFGLTASVWTQDSDAAKNIGNKVDCGTWFMNRCDYLSPNLPWSGRKQSGVGCSLGTQGFHEITQPKSFNQRLL